MYERNPDDFHQLKNRVLETLPDEYEVSKGNTAYTLEFVGSDAHPEFTIGWVQTRMAGNWFDVEVHPVDADSFEESCDTADDVVAFVTETLDST